MTSSSGKKVERKRQKMNKGKTPSSDGLPVEVIQAKKKKKNCVKIVKNGLRKGYFPKEWKRASLVLFNKKGKDTKVAISYRPFWLLDAWGKELDKLLTQSVHYYLYSTNNLQSNQYGFTRGRSTTGSIKCVFDTIRGCFDEGKHVCIISFNIKSVMVACSAKRAGKNQLLNKYLQSVKELLQRQRYNRTKMGSESESLTTVGAHRVPVLVPYYGT